MAIVRDFIKEALRRPRNASKSSYIIFAAFRSAREGDDIRRSDWRITEMYGVVTATSGRDALGQFLIAHPELVEETKNWSYDSTAQRVWGVVRPASGSVHLNGFSKNNFGSVTVGNHTIRYLWP